MRSVIYVSLLFFALGSCSKTNKNKPLPNIVWITSEDNSKHYMSLFDDHGVPTPNIDKLAQQGVRYNHAFSNTSVCSASRSTLISGCYGPRLASHYHRHIKKVNMPDGLKMFPAYLKQASYYTVNNAKEDYNINMCDSVWDESSYEADYRNRKAGQPFFYVKNLYITHESQTHFSQTFMDTVPNINDYCFVQPNHPHTPVFEYTNARYRDLIQKMDSQVGEVLAELEKDGLMDSTIIFYFSDHGGVLPGSKGYLTETGLHIPLVVYVPKMYHDLIKHQPGSEANEFVSFVDFGPTLLNLVGITLPEQVDGSPFLGNDITEEQLKTKEVTFGYADRFDEKIDMVRSLRKGKYKYVRNFQPYNYDGIMNNYRYRQLAYMELGVLNKKNQLDSLQSLFFKKKPLEALYDVESDPYELNNLATFESFDSVLLEMRLDLVNWMKKLPDLSLYPESYLLEEAIKNPCEFGQQNKTDIETYIDVANLALQEFSIAKDQINTGIQSTDPWVRYWSLNNCIIFYKQAKGFSDIIKNIATNDEVVHNQVLAIQYLALTGYQNPISSLKNILYTVQNSTEALFVLNAIVWLESKGLINNFQINLEEINYKVLNDMLVQERLKYLCGKLQYADYQDVY